MQTCKECGICMGSTVRAGTDLCCGCSQYVYNVFMEKDMKEDFKLTDMGTGAKKHLDGKCLLELVPPEMILALGDVLTYGAKKYAARNWEQGIPYMTSYASAMRHLMKWASGEDVDDESGLKHIEQAMLNLGMIVTQARRGRVDLDDRSVKHDDL